jgi:hypothetical protein
MSKNEKNYWPHFIVGLVMFTIGMGTWTLVTAINNPVEMDNSYMRNYHQVDADLNKILQSGFKFDKKYEFSLLNSDLQEGENELKIDIKDKNGNVVKDAKIEILVTRPETTKLDKNLKAQFDGEEYRAKVILDKKGRWNIQIRVVIKDLEKFKTYKLHTL